MWQEEALCTHSLLFEKEEGACICQLVAGDFMLEMDRWGFVEDYMSASELTNEHQEQQMLQKINFQSEKTLFVLFLYVFRLSLVLWFF